MRKIVTNLFIALLVFVIFNSCKSEYENIIDREMRRGIVDDSLIFGMEMGLTRKEFFDICWKLNKEKLIDQGSGNGMAYHKDPYDSLQPNKAIKELQFYGIFDKNDTMRGMSMIYNFSAWGSFEKKYNSKSMMDTLINFYTKTRKGNPFIEMDLGLDKYKALVKVDGQRQILIYPKNDKDVIVKIEDLKFKYNQK